MKSLIALAVIIGCFAFVSDEDFKQAVREDLAYCKMVDSGEVSDYRNNYATECTEEKIKEFSEIVR